MVSSVFLLPLPVAESTRLATRRGGRSNLAARPATRLLAEFVGDQDDPWVRVIVDAFLSPPRYSPLVVVGAEAVGKSALLAGLTARWNERSPEAPAWQATADEFARGYADALETDSLDSFRARSGQAGAVVIDGLETLVDKASAQLELARWLDALDDARKPVLLSCRREAELPPFHPALASRLQGGLVVPLAAPGPAARRRILVDLLARRRLRVDDDALETLTTGLAGDATVRPTVPELARFVDRLAEQASHEPQPWTAETVARHLSDEATRPAVDVADVAKVVAEYFGLRVSDLRGQSRRQQVVRARSLATYLARQATGLSLENLGRYFGGRDHTTTMHACRTMEERRRTDPLIRQALEALARRVQSLGATRS